MKDYTNPIYKLSLEELLALFDEKIEIKKSEGYGFVAKSFYKNNPNICKIAMGGETKEEAIANLYLYIKNR